MKIFLGISSFQLLVMFRRGLFYSFLAIYLKHFLGLSVTVTSLFATLPMVLNVLAQRYVWGRLSDKYQKRRTLIIWGELLGGIGTLALWACHLIPDEKTISGWVIIIGLSLIEIFWSMSNIGWSALISDIYKQEDRGTVMGKLEGLGGVGRIIGVLAGGLLYDRMGTSFPGWGFYQGTLFFISAGAMFLSVLPMRFMVPEGGISPAEIPVQTVHPEKKASSLVFPVFIAAMTFIHFGRNSVAITMAQYLALPDGFNLSAITLSHVVNLRSVGIILAGLITGILIKKKGMRHLLVSGTILAIASLFILGLTHTLLFACISSLLMGFSEVIILASAYELASCYIPAHKRGTLFSVFNATFFLSWGMAGTFIAGPITDGLISMGTARSAAYQASFNAAGIMTFMGLLILFLLYRLEHRVQEGI